ncbi:MAG: hypothetical protein IKJ19_03690 [Clostridia bacterium]|nr:hypothetical protein [Clostridia bacterium]
MVALGIILGIVVMLSAYFFSMLGYFKLRQRKSNLKYGVEIGVLSFAVLFSFAIKVVIIFVTEPVNGNFWQTVSNFYKAVYSSIGGLTFEGLSDFDNELVKNYLQCLYTGSSLYASLMVLSVITSKVSYEIYSGLRMIFSLGRNARMGDSDFYIFSSVNPETVELAHSVNEHYLSKNNSRKCVIIFAGANLPAFDGKEELHREIMANGYYYDSYTQNQNGYDSVFDHVRIPLINDFFVQKPQSANSESRIHFFSLTTNAELRGCESLNSAEAFSEIEALVKKYVKQKRLKNGELSYSFLGGNVIDFYVLSDNDINYEFYKRELIARIINVLSEYDVQKLYEQVIVDRPEITDVKVGDFSSDSEVKVNKIAKYLSYYFQLHLINEAYITANDLAKKRKSVFLKDFKNIDSEAKDCAENEFLKDSLPTEDNTYRTMVLGFGSNGQQALKSLYQNTAYVDANGVPTRFVADVYDTQTKNIAGIFGFNHPLFLCIDKGDNVEPVTKAEWEKQNEQIENIYPDAVVSEYYQQVEKELTTDSAYLNDEKYKNTVELYLKSAPKTFEDAKQTTILPVVCFHSISAFEHRFLTFINDKAGYNQNGLKWGYKSFIIALGNDEMNILTANAIISNIKQTRNEKGEHVTPEFTRTIYVNVRDAKNRMRINWTHDDEKRLPGNKVVIFGDSKDLFSYDNIINDSATMKFDYAYNNIHSVIEADGKNIILGSSANLIELANKVNSKFDEKGVYYDMRLSWLKKNDFKKQSNYAVEIFSTYYQKALKKILKSAKEQNVENKVSSAIINQLLAIEHERWNRFHIANGWMFEKNRSDESKEHNCICALDMLTLSVKVYDLTNVLINAGDISTFEG